MKVFQLVLLGVAGVLGIVAVLVFGGFIPSPISSGGAGYGGKVTMWGPFESDKLQGFVNDLNQDYSDSFALVYEEKNPETFEKELVEALASGVGPDLVIFPHDMLLRQGDKFLTIPYSSFSQIDFESTFIDGASVYLTPAGAVALPLAVDPIVMYWNKQILRAAGIAAPPKTWQEVSALTEQFTVRDDRGNVTESFVALGGLRNMANLTEVVSTLLMQTGDKIVSYDSARDMYYASLGGDEGSTAASALAFYVDFANPAKDVYSWNSALPLSRTAFEAGTVGLYFGLASEYDGIARRNPHLEFGVAEVPRLAAGKGADIFGRYYAVGILNASKNINTAYSVAFTLLEEENALRLSKAALLPSVLRTVLGASAGDPALDLFARAAVSTRPWLDPNPEESRKIFSDMVEAVIIGRSTARQALNEARERLHVELTQ